MQNIEICNLLVCPDSLMVNLHISSNDCHTQLTIESVIG